MSKRQAIIIIITLSLFTVVGIGFSTFYLLKSQALTDANTALSNTRDALTDRLASTSRQLAAANETIAALSNELNLTAEELEEVEDDYRREQRKNEDLEDEYRDTIETVKDLDKLAKLDEELLAKYSRVAFLNENYIPSRLKEIDEDSILPSRNTQFFHRDALPFLEDLLEDAARDNVDLQIISAYRSFETQAELKGNYTVLYGSGANAFSADQGFSEHQLGTAVDFTDTEANALRLSFADTEAYDWLLKNAHKHGFILSYPEGNAFYIFEPWHWRFVGEDLARDLNRDDAYFYDWEQRDINEYLIKIFD